MSEENRHIALGCDHVGLELKKAVAEYLKEHGWTIHDVGAETAERTDYPIYGEAAARLVQSGKCRFGIIMCGTGIGIAIAANKVTGIRCVTCSEPYSAFMSRSHNNANMLSFGARVVGRDLALMIVETFLKTDYEGGRHQHRLDQIEDIERREINLRS